MNIVFGQKRLVNVASRSASIVKYPEQAVITVEGIKGAKKSRRILMNAKAAQYLELVVGEVENIDREGVIIGGNFVNWYGGFDSYITASEHFDADQISAPSMGRKQPGEEQLINHLPYLNWKDWIHKLNEFKIGIHLMRTHAAGTFALNCAYLGIPCIGYKGLDTQELCHPDLTVEVGNLRHAKELLGELKNNSYLYKEYSNLAKENYKTYYHENIFNTTWKK